MPYRTGSVRTTPGTFSPKAVLAAVIPAVGAVVAVAGQWAITGEFDRAEMVTAAMGVVTALLAFAGAWAGNPGSVEVTTPGVPSDDVLMASRPVRDRLTDPPDVA